MEPFLTEVDSQDGRFTFKSGIYNASGDLVAKIGGVKSGGSNESLWDVLDFVTSSRTNVTPVSGRNAAPERFELERGLDETMRLFITAVPIVFEISH